MTTGTTTRDEQAVAALRRATAGLTDPRTWRALGYVLVGSVSTLLPLCVAAVLLVVTVPLVLLGVGIPLTVWALGFVASVNGIERRRAAWVGVDVAPRPLLGGSVVERFGDRSRWRHAVFALTAWAPAWLAVTALVVVWGVPAQLVSMPVWGWTSDELSWPEIIGLTAVGAVLLCLAPWATQWLGRLLAAFTATVIGPDRLASMQQRVEDLSENRDAILAAVADERRRIERNLHDGVQQQLVALGIDIGLAEAKIESDPDAARALLAEARDRTRAAIAELRVIGRGLHPAILGDRGLDAALSAVAAGSAVPVALRCDLAVEPPTAVAEAAYFVVSEALTNVMKHSGARAAAVDVVGTGSELVLTVYDDGRGGATTAVGSGLAGVAARVRGMEGHVEVRSPAGGPTTVSVTLPWGTPTRDTDRR